MGTYYCKNSIDEMTNQDFYSLHWYSKLRTKAERRQLYGWLRGLGLSRCEARRVYDWSTPHIISYVRTTVLGKEQITTKDIEMDLINLPEGEK